MQIIPIPNHATLPNLLWSVAGHTMDTTLDMLTNDIDNVTTITTENVILEGTGIGQFDYQFSTMEGSSQFCLEVCLP